MVLDVVPWESALQTLVFREVTSDDHLHDYAIHQAYRSVACAFSGSSTDVVFLLLDHICRTVCNSQVSRDVMAFLLCRMVLEEGSSYGEGNHIPDVKHTLPSLVRKFAAYRLDPMASFSSAAAPVATDRRIILGFVLLLRDVVHTLKHACSAKDVFAVSTAFDFVSEVLHVLPLVNLHAEGKRDVQFAKTPTTAEAEAHNHGGAQITRLTLEANITTIAVAHAILSDVAEADMATSSPKKSTNGVVVVDMQIQPLLWEAASRAQLALGRHELWLKREAAAVTEAARRKWLVDRPDTHQTATAVGDRWYLADFLKLWDSACLSPLKSSFERLEIMKVDVIRSMGSSDARSALEIKDHQWKLTVRMCLLVSAACGGFTSVYSPISRMVLDLSSPASVTDVVARAAKSIADQVASPDDLEPQSASSSAFVATIGLLSALSRVLFAFPMDTQQEAVWREHHKFAAAIHQDLIRKALRYRDPAVMKLGSMFSSCLIRATALSSGSSLSGGAATESVGAAWLDGGGSESLFELLQGNENYDDAAADGASTGAIELAILAAMARPHFVIPALFSLLSDKSNRICRQNAISVLAALPPSVAVEQQKLSTEIHLIDSALERSTAPADLGSTNNSRVSSDIPAIKRQLRVLHHRKDHLNDVLRLLSEHLLERIHDDDVLEQRMHAASLFEMVPPHVVIRPLVIAALHRGESGDSTTRRSAASRALRAVLYRPSVVRAAQGSPNVFDVALEGVRQLLDVALEIYEERCSIELPPVRPLNAGSDARTLSAANLTPADLVRHAQLHTLPDSELADGVPDAGEQEVARRQEILRLRLSTVTVTALKQWSEDWTQCRQFTTSDDLEFVSAVLEQAWNLLSTYGVSGLTKVDTRDAKIIIGDVADLQQQLAVRCGTALITAVANSLTPLTGTHPSKSIARAICHQLQSFSVDEEGQVWSFLAVFRLVSLKTLLQNTPRLQHHSLLIVQDREAELALGETLLKTFFTRNTLDDALKRLALEVLTRLPIDHVLGSIAACLGTEKPWFLSAFDAENSPTASWVRVYVFCMSTFLARNGFLFSAESSAENQRDDTAALLMEATNKFLPGLQHVQEQLLNLAHSQMAVPHLKAIHACVEAMALLSVLGLSGGGVADPAFHSAFHIPATALFTINPLSLIVPPATPQTQQLVEIAPVDITEDKKKEVDFDEVRHALHIIQATVRIVRQQPFHPAVSKDDQWTAVWCRTYLPILTALANRCVSLASSMQDRGAYESWCSVASGCIDVVFTFLVWRPPNAQKVTISLAERDEDALVSFAVGCLGFEKVPVVQFGGVKLVSAVMAVLAPSWDPTSHHREVELQRMMLLLERVSRMNPIPESRNLAEAVLRTIAEGDQRK